MKAAATGLLLLFVAAADGKAAPVLETVAEMDHAPGNIGVLPDGRVIVSEHPTGRPETVAVIIDKGKVSPFPPGGWSKVLSAEPARGEEGMRPVLGVRADADGIVWMLSGNGNQSLKHLYAWDTKANAMIHDYTFDKAATGPRSFLNDLALAPRHGKIFISDPAGDADASIAVVDLQTGKLTRRLQGDMSVRSEPIDAVIDGKVVGSTGPDGKARPLRGAVNPITIDPEEEWLYYAPLSGRTVYRIRVADLLDASLSEEALSKKVEHYAEKPASAGITIDNAGNIYVADVQARGIGVTSPREGYRLLVQDDKRLDWADGIATGPDGYIYVASSELYRFLPSHRVDNAPPRPPFYVTRFKALADTTVGR
jgi:sugar lactone lactonase YvrE